MAVIQMKALLEAGVQFGHRVDQWNPKMAPYIYTQRAGTHIIDLEKTSECIDQAYEIFKEIGELNGKVLFVGTKKLAQKIIQDEAMRCGHYYVNQRWLGGTLTNFNTIRKSVDKYFQYKKMQEEGVFERLPKKEVSEITSKMARAEKFLGGIFEMTEMPKAIFVVDPREEKTAVLEARKLHIPVFGIIDTNCDPDYVDYPIPANNDAISSLRLVISAMVNALIEGAGGVVEAPEVMLARSKPQKEELEEEALVVEQVKVEEAEEEPKPRKRAKKAPVEEQPEEVEVVVEEVKAEEPVQEPVVEEAPVEEEVKAEEKVEEAPKAEPKQRKPRAKKEAPKEEPVEEAAPVEEAQPEVQEEPKEEIPNDDEHNREWLSKQTVKQLREIARQRGYAFDVYWKLVKADFVEYLATHK